MHRIALALLIANALPAAQTVLLKNGGRIETESISREGDTVFLHTKRLTWVMDRNEIAAIVDPDAPAPAAKPAAASMASTPGAPVQRLIDDAARRHGLPASLVHAVAAVESGYSQAARSGPGAIGVMQLMPATARSLGADPHDTEQNIDAGVRFLRYLLLKYQSDPNQLALALAAYNAGPSAVDRFGGVPPYAETRRYVDKVITRYQAREAQPAKR